MFNCLTSHLLSNISLCDVGYSNRTSPISAMGELCYASTAARENSRLIENEQSIFDCELSNDDRFSMRKHDFVVSVMVSRQLIHKFKKKWKQQWQYVSASRIALRLYSLKVKFKLIQIKIHLSYNLISLFYPIIIFFVVVSRYNKNIIFEVG